MSHINELIRRMDALEKRQKDLETKLSALTTKVENESSGSANIQYVKPVKSKTKK